MIPLRCTVHTLAILLLFATAITLPACDDAQPDAGGPVAPAVDDEDTSLAEADRFYLVLDLPKTQYKPGESLNATVMAVNHRDEPVNIQATSSALCKLSLWRPESTQWNRFKTFPEMAAAVMTDWTLEPGQRRSFTFNVPIKPDWPTHELIRVKAQLNGMPELTPHVDIEILRSE
jgi:hypothetical protein